VLLTRMRRLLTQRTERPVFFGVLHGVVGLDVRLRPCAIWQAGVRSRLDLVGELFFARWLEAHI
jgi:hypothetical protein